jgi:hypothetical protein
MAVEFITRKAYACPALKHPKGRKSSKLKAKMVGMAISSTL